MRSRWWPTTCGRRNRASRRSPSAGTMDRTEWSAAPTSSRGWRRLRRSLASSCGTRAMRRLRSPVRRRRWRRATRSPSSPTRRCSRPTVPGLAARGQPIAWTHRLVGPAIVARWAPSAFKDGIDPDAVDGAAQILYDIPAIRVEYVRHEEPVLNTGFWRGVGVTHNTFVIESFIDELAAAAKEDPVAYRRALLGKSPRARAVLDLAAQAAGWGQPLPA